jgi:serine/threonine protein phosphatase PrpC
LIPSEWSLQGYAITHTGRRRAQNEDAYICDPSRAVFLVADGMGGENYGEVASRLSAEQFTQIITPYLLDDEMTVPFEHLDPGDTFEGLLMHAVKGANSAVMDYVENQPSHKGMGSTLTAAVLQDQQLYVAHVGDSRLYRIDSAEIQQITEDHTRVQQMVMKKLITAEQARVHPQKNIITQCIGRKKRIKPDIFHIDMDMDSTYLICSDGLNDMVTDPEIQRLVLKAHSLIEAGALLVHTANENGGKDNITAVLFRTVANADA